MPTNATTHRGHTGHTHTHTHTHTEDTMPPVTAWRGLQGVHKHFLFKNMRSGDGEEPEAK